MKKIFVILFIAFSIKAYSQKPIVTAEGDTLISYMHIYREKDTKMTRIEFNYLSNISPKDLISLISAYLLEEYNALPKKEEKPEKVKIGTQKSK